MWTQLFIKLLPLYLRRGWGVLSHHPAVLCTSAWHEGFQGVQVYYVTAEQWCTLEDQRHSMSPSYEREEPRQRSGLHWAHVAPKGQFSVTVMSFKGEEGSGLDDLTTTEKGTKDKYGSTHSSFLGTSWWRTESKCLWLDFLGTECILFTWNNVQKWFHYFRRLLLD